MANKFNTSDSRFGDAVDRATDAACNSAQSMSPKIVAARQTLHAITREPDMVGDAVVGLFALTCLCHGMAARGGWWHDPRDGRPIDRNDGEMIALMHSELSEALEAVRKSSADSHLPHRRGVEVELADLLIRVFDYAGARGMDLGGAVAEKLAYNATRQDHTPEARAAAGGKAF